jgi:N-acetylmuramoyl-L-alanine amidase
VNFNANLILLSYTIQLRTLCSKLLKRLQCRTQVSSHYVIADDGSVIQMLNDYLRAWHAGRGSWGKDTDINSSSIGIELDNNGTEVFLKHKLLA